MSQDLRFLDLIAKKRDRGRHTRSEIESIARAAAGGSVPDYQLSAWLMAVVCRGMNASEAAALTRAMAESGETLDLASLPGPKVDKHSTGGVGDGISLALAPLAAAAGLVVPMMSGRGLAHTGGTLDKLEAIPGMKVRLETSEIRAQLSRIGVCMFGQSARLAPADRKLYALRDATATVESRPLIVASILSKKLAEGLDALVLDVKVGAGAILRDEDEAVELGKALVGTAKELGLKTVALLTSMDQPLGRCVGNAVEVRQAIEVLQGDCTAGDYVETLLALGGWMVHLGGLARGPEEGARKLEALIRGGQAVERFKRMVAAQGGDPRVADDPSLLPQPTASTMVASPASGFLAGLDARKVGEAAVALGAGRATMEQAVDPAAGLRLDRKLGDRVKAGESLARLYASDESRLAAARELFLSAVRVGAKPPKVPPVIRKTLK